MTVRERMLALKLAEQQARHSEWMKKLGVEIRIMNQGRK